MNCPLIGVLFLSKHTSKQCVCVCCGKSAEQFNTVVLQGLDADMFEEILSYIYSGIFQVSLDSVQHLYQAADLLQLDYVRDTCSSYMAMNMERSTCVDLYKFAHVFRVDVVRNSCLQCICQHFVEVSSSEEFCSLSVDQLTEIISHDELEVDKETRVWEAVVRWVQHSKEDRLQHLPNILLRIRFNLLTSDDTAAVLEHPLVREDPGSSEVIRNVVNRKPRFGMKMEMALLYDYGTDEVLWMNPGEGKFIRCHYNLIPRNMGAITRDNEIYILAKDCYNITMHKYNHVENNWEQKSTVYEGTEDQVDPLRPRHVLVEVDGHLFHLFDSEESPVVELNKYNQHTNEWHNCSSTLQLGASFYVWVAVSCNQRIYLFTQTDLHWYDPRVDRWTRKPLSGHSPEVQFDYSTTLVAMGTKIFCTDDSFFEISVYDTESDSWSEHPGLPRSYENGELEMENCSLFVLQNKLHALVGWHYWSGPDSVPVKQVFVYDTAGDVWRDLVTLPEGECWCIDPTCHVARMYLPYLSTSLEETQGTAKPEGPCTQ
ncbi:kelch repeat and BTB domain-containing protein 2-like isoform X1 [Branchiostoma floridae x Branchiostoma belcheri]